MIRLSIAVAQDADGKTAVLWTGKPQDTQEGIDLMESDAAIQATGLTGPVEVAVFRDLHAPLRRRATVIAPPAISHKSEEAQGTEGNPVAPVLPESPEPGPDAPESSLPEGYYPESVPDNGTVEPKKKKSKSK